MIHAVVLAEYHQTKRHILAVMLVVFLVTLAVRMLVGLGGVACVALVLIPSGCLGIGVGTFSEEFSKGQLRFLYAMPVSRLSVWSIKCASGVLGMILLALSVGLALVLAGGADEQELQAWEILLFLDVSVLDVGLPYLAWAFYAYASGMFCVMMCHSLLGANLLGMCVSLLPLPALWLAFWMTGADPPSRGVALAVTAAAVCLLAGSFVLFNLRNPFLERKWLLRAVGTPCVGAALAVLCLGSAGAAVWPVAVSVPRFDRVTTVVPSPDGERLMLITWGVDPWGGHGYIVSADGTVEADLGSGVACLRTAALTWRPGPGEPAIAYLQGGSPAFEEVGAVEALFKPQLVLRHLRTGKETYLSYLARTDSERGGTSRYKRWSSDGQRLLGATYYRGERRSVSGFAQNVATNEVTETPRLAEGARRRGQLGFRADGLIVIEVGETKDGHYDKLIVIDPRSNTRDEWTLPSGVSSWALLPDCDSVVLVRDSILDDIAGIEVLLYDTSSQGDATNCHGGSQSMI